MHNNLHISGLHYLLETAGAKLQFNMSIYGFDPVKYFKLSADGNIYTLKIITINENTNNNIFIIPIEEMSYFTQLCITKLCVEYIIQ